MDKEPSHKNASLLEAAVEAVMSVGIHISIQADKAGRVDKAPRISIRQGDQQLMYEVEVHHALQPASLGIVLQQLERRCEKVILITDYVTPALADELKARQLAFMDTAGNAYIENGSLLIWVKGQKRPAKRVTFNTGRAFQPTGLQLVFTLLCNPQALNRSYRELAHMAGVAHGTVGWVMPDLQQQGFIRDLDGKRGTRRLLQRQRLLDQWADAYARVLRPRTLLGRYYVNSLDNWADWPLAEDAAQWGGEPAAAILTGYLQPGELTVYAEKMTVMLAARMRFLKQPEPGRTAVIEVRRRFWNFLENSPVVTPAEASCADLVPALLVYADLLATGDARCMETAKMIYDTHIVRLFAEK